MENILTKCKDKALVLVSIFYGLSLLFNLIYDIGSWSRSFDLSGLVYLFIYTALYISTIVGIFIEKRELVIFPSVVIAAVYIFNNIEYGMGDLSLLSSEAVSGVMKTISVFSFFESLASSAISVFIFFEYVFKKDGYLKFVTWLFIGVIALYLLYLILFFVLVVRDNVSWYFLFSILGSMCRLIGVFISYLWLRKDVLIPSSGLKARKESVKVDSKVIDVKPEEENTK